MSELLTDLEHEAMHLTGRLANACGAIIGNWWGWWNVTGNKYWYTSKSRVEIFTVDRIESLLIVILYAAAVY